MTFGLEYCKTCVCVFVFVCLCVCVCVCVCVYIFYVSICYNKLQKSTLVSSSCCIIDDRYNIIQYNIIYCKKGIISSINT